MSYRHLERPYTRTSKYRKKAYIRATPNLKIVRFDVGNVQRDYEVTLQLVTKGELQMRQEAIESARLSSNRLLEKKLGKNAFHLRVRVYPHQILRENPLAAGAGADRFSTGMSHPFGKPIGIAARLRKGQPIFTLRVDKTNLKTAMLALKRAAYKLPGECMIVEERARKAVA